MKFVKVMFSQVFVCPRGGSLSGRPWTETHLDRDPPGQRPLQTETPWTEIPLDRDPPRQRPPPQTETSWTETPPRQRPPWTEIPPPPCMVTGGRYASYWNAFLFVNYSHIPQYPAALVPPVETATGSHRSGVYAEHPTHTWKW